MVFNNHYKLGINPDKNQVFFVNSFMKFHLVKEPFFIKFHSIKGKFIIIFITLLVLKYVVISKHCAMSNCVMLILGVILSQLYRISADGSFVVFSLAFIYFLKLCLLIIKLVQNYLSGTLGCLIHQYLEFRLM